MLNHRFSKPCRSLTGAWIETRIMRRDYGSDLVAPSRGRGLKLYFVSRGQLRVQRRSLTGAWIETKNR